ncbi:hypothetical protein PC128_g21407 [Phytophthora cactorum]|nr:hypothetical protein PC120_g19548 [Phytophthora cactorum]KAG3051903.1 hypothetical protein PC121_g17575 [Phytophthora cactorum]KAG3158928.1 hypothetical protein PC128_g21407 [Phytophthora cactorum]KAG4047307.1 hypothetical protein PC123_g17325 [Phytophthora cactorum]
MQRREPVPSDSSPKESVCIFEYVEGASGRQRTINVASPPRYAQRITQLPGLTWKNFLRNLKDGAIEQVCLITDTDSASLEVSTVSDGYVTSRPKRAKPKSASEERFAAKTSDALRESDNLAYQTAREYSGVFLDKITAELPADRSIRHKINLLPGSKY